jgi:hypothetical protein
MDHSTLEYLVNKLVLEGRICRWFLLFQELNFEVKVKPRKMNSWIDQLSRIETREFGGLLDDQLLDSELFRIEAVPTIWRT